MGEIVFLQDGGVRRDRVEGLASGLLPGWAVRWATGPGPVAGRARGADVIVTVNEQVGAGDLEAVRPRMVSVSFTGTDHVDLEAAGRIGVAVANVPGYATASVAELAIGMILACFRRIVDADAAVRAGRWREGLTGRELSGSTVGIVGTGRIGLAVATRLAPFGVRILGWSRRPSPEIEAMGGENVALDDLLARSDVVTLHVPLVDGTRGLIGERAIALMKPGVVIVNAARGPVVDASALARALHDGRIGAAAIDVYDVEPVSRENPLLTAPRTLLLPHVAFATEQALDRKATITIENVRAFLDGERMNRVA